MRKLALAMAVAMASSRVYALGLGDIELYSALNEPLNAEVRLLAEQADELNNAVVRLAPNEEFARAGVERTGVLSDINFTIERRNDGTAIVKITSTQPIREPFLDFIVQLRWQSGRLLREYTLLLDPPVFGAEKAAPVTESSAAPVAAVKPEPIATVAAPAPKPMPMPAPAEPAAAPVSPVQAPAAAPRAAQQHTAAVAVPAGAKAGKSGVESEKTYGPTRRNETLWNIALSLRSDDSVSVYQMMMALLKDNPQAFYDGNINNLKAGYVLRVPEKSVVATVDQAAAAQEAARQFELWQQAKRGSVGRAEKSRISSEPAAGQAQTAQPTAAALEQEKETARLRLVAPGDTSAKSSAAGGVQAEIAKLRSDLAIALESSDTAKRESDDLRSRVTALEEQINSLQRLLTLKNDALNEMQKRSGMAAPQTTGESPAPAVEMPSIAPGKTAPVKPAPVQPSPKPGDMFANPTLLGAVAGAVLLLLLVLWLIMRRRRNTDEIEPVDSIDDEATIPVVPIQSAQEEYSKAPAAEEFGDAQRMTQIAEEVAQGAEPDIQQAANNLDVLHTPEGNIDPIVEADVYLAYRRYQQAEALVQSALAKQPGRQDLRAKLLEIYYSAKNADAFQTEAQTLYENLGKNPNDPVWQQILPMGRELCHDHELFSSQGDAHGVRQNTAGKDDLFNESEGKPNAFDGGSSAGKGFRDHGVAVTGGAGGTEHSFELNTGVKGSTASSAESDGETSLAAQDEKMEFDLNLGKSPSRNSIDAAMQGSAADTSESLSAALDLDGLPATATKHRDSATAEGKEQRNSWEIESATSDFGNIDFGLDDADLLAGTDVVGTKLDLARAYLDMGDNDSARDILKEVIQEGNEQQKQEAKVLVEKIA